MADLYTLQYKEKANPSLNFTRLLDRLKSEYFKSDTHKINYLRVILRRKNGQFAFHGYSGTKYALQHVIDMFYIQDLLDEFTDKREVKEEVKGLFL